MNNKTEIEFDYETEDGIACEIFAQVWVGEKSDGVTPPCHPTVERLFAHIDGKFFPLSRWDLGRAEYIAMQKFLAE
jgi:hypothetical protein